MYNQRPQKFKKLIFKKISGANYIQEFIQIKLANPAYIQKLKERQLIKIQTQKVKINFKNLNKQMAIQKQKLEKSKLISQEIKQIVSLKINQCNETGSQMIQQQRRIQNLKDLRSKKFENDKASSQSIMAKLKSQIQNVSDLLENEGLTNISFNGSTKQKLSSTIIKYKVKRQEYEEKFQLLRQKKVTLKKNIRSKQEKKQKINQLIFAKQNIHREISKLQNFKLKLIKSFNQKRKKENRVNHKAQEQCVEKLVKFVNELRCIVQNLKSNFQQNRNLLHVLMNVYCPKKAANKMNDWQSQNQKIKHVSIQTDVTVQTDYTESINKSNQSKRGDFEDQNLEICQIPLLMQHSLHELLEKSNIQKKLSKFLPSENLDFVPLRKQSSFEQQNNKQKYLNVHRNSMPSSFLSTNQNFKNNYLKTQERISLLSNQFQVLQKQQNQLDLQINLLQKKCYKKDLQIDQIRKYNRKSQKKVK